MKIKYIGLVETKNQGAADLFWTAYVFCVQRGVKDRSCLRTERDTLLVTLGFSAQLPMLSINLIFCSREMPSRLSSMNFRKKK